MNSPSPAQPSPSRLPGDGMVDQQPTAALLHAARRVASHLDSANLDTTALPTGMGSALRALRDALNQAPTAVIEPGPLAWGDGHDAQDIGNVALSKGTYGCNVPLYGPSAMEAEARRGFAEGLQAALKAIAKIPAPATYDQMNGHEDAYRAVEQIAGATVESNPDRMAVRMLVAAGCVPAAVANKALQISHGFEHGSLDPANDADGAAAPLQELLGTDDPTGLETMEAALRSAMDALTSPASADQVPEGCFVGPLEPSEEMKRRGAFAACSSWDFAGEPMDPDDDMETAIGVWKAMAEVAQRRRKGDEPDREHGHHRRRAPREGEAAVLQRGRDRGRQWHPGPGADRVRQAVQRHDRKARHAPRSPGVRGPGADRRMGCPARGGPQWTP